jgi:hypothetical protein
MIVKLKDNINIDKFLHMNFGTNNINECVSYYEYFSTENLKKPLNAKMDSRITTIARRAHTKTNRRFKVFLDG